MTIAPLPRDRCEELIRAFFADAIPVTVLREDRGDSKVARLFPDEENSMVLKLWHRPGLRGAVRRLLRSSPAQREYRALRRFSEIGIYVPAPLAHCPVRTPCERWTDALFLEDLGECELALEHLKTLIRSGREAEVKTFLDDVVDMTQRMVAAGVYDNDHTFVNILATPDGRAARLDLEITRLRSARLNRTRRYGDMLGRLLGSFAFAVQPEVDRVTDFASDLSAALNCSPKVLRYAEVALQRMLTHQVRTSGIDTRVQLPWSSPPTSPG